MAAKIRRRDKVIVLTAVTRGRSGEVIEVAPAAGRALVRGISMVKRHQKQTRSRKAASSARILRSPVQSGAGRSERTQADPRRDSSLSARAMRAARCALQAFRSRDRWLRKKIKAAKSAKGSKAEKSDKARAPRPAARMGRASRHSLEAKVSPEG